MAPNTRSPLSLSVASTGVAVGREVMLAKPCTRFTMQVTQTGSTKGIFRMKGSVDGINFVAIGSANSSVTSTAAVTVTSTSPHAFTTVRVDQVSLVAKAGGQTARASITGA